jgi:hypothetical protein
MLGTPIVTDGVLAHPASMKAPGSAEARMVGMEDDEVRFRELMERRARLLAELDPAVIERWRAERPEEERRDSVPLTVEEIRLLSDDDIHDRLVGRLFTVVPHDVAGLKRQHPLVRAWYTTKHFEGEVMNGGLHQFFCNTDEAGEPYWELVLEGYDTLELHDVRIVIEDQVLPVARSEQALRASIAGTLDFSRSYGLTALRQLDGLIEVQDDVRNQVVRAHPEAFAI